MLKIKDATGKVVGTLKDEDNAPEMKEPELKKKNKKKEDKEKEDADSETSNLCGL